MAQSSVITLKLKQIVEGKEQVGELSMSLKELQHVSEAVQRQLDSVNYRASINACASFGFAVNDLVGSVGAMTEKWATFDAAMRGVNTMAGKSAEDLGALTDKVTELAKEIPMARDALANGLYQVISNGVPEDNWIDFLRDSSRAAVGGMADLGGVVTVTSTILKNYGMAWSEAGTVQNLIQKTAQYGVTSFEQLQQALPRVTGNAATLGVEIEELMATFATLTGVSGNTAEVSTQLAAVFTALIKPSSEASKMAAEMGIQFDAMAIKAAGGMQNFLQSLDQSVKQYASASGKLEQEIYAKLFGSAESLRALGPLTGQLADTYSLNVQRMSEDTDAIGQAFESMAGTSEAKAQLLENRFAGFFDMVGAGVGKIKPMLDFSAPLFTTVSGLKAVISAGKIAIATFSKTSAGVLILGTNSKSTAKMVNLLRNNLHMTSSAAKICAMSLRGILIASGVGAALVALGYGLEWLIGKLGETKGKEDDLVETMRTHEEEIKEFESQATQSVGAEIAALDKLYNAAIDESKSREERTKAIRQMQNEYPDYFKNINAESASIGALSSQYQQLKTDILAAARARSAQSRIDNITGELLDIDRQIEVKREEARTEGEKASAFEERFTEPVRDSHGHIKEGENRIKLGYESFVNDAWKRVDDAFDEIDKLKAKKAERIKDLDYLTKVIEGAPSAPIKANNPITTTPTRTPTSNKSGSTTTQSTTLTEEQRAAAIDVEEVMGRVLDTQAKYDQALSELRLKQKYVSKGQRDILERDIEEVTRQRDAFLGVKKVLTEKEQAAGIDVAAVMARNKTCVSDYTEAIAQLMLKQRYANTEEYSALEKNIKQLTREQEVLQGLPITVDKGAKSIKALQRNVELLNEELNETTDPNRARAIVEEIEDYNNRIGQLQGNTPVYDANATTLKGISDNISVLTERLNKASLSESAAINKEIRQWERMSDAIRNAGMSAQDTFSIYKSGWSSIKGVSSGFDGLSDAIEEDGTMWQRLSKIIDSAIQIADGIMGVINLLTTASKAHTVAKTAETAATVASTTATATAAVEAPIAAAAETPLIAANKLATASFLELATASYFAAHAYIPFAGFAIASGFVAGATAITKSLGVMAFADGGIAYGPTLGLFAEYAGANHNPEVVAPLDKLRKLIGDGDPQGVSEVEFKLRGETLYGAINNYRRRVGRSR